MMDHKVFNIGMPSDTVVFIVNHTYRSYIHANKIIGIDDLGLVVQKYLMDATLTFERRKGFYQVVAINEPMTKDEWEAVKEIEVTPYLEKAYGEMGVDAIVNHVKDDGEATG